MNNTERKLAIKERLNGLAVFGPPGVLEIREPVAVIFDVGYHYNDSKNRIARSLMSCGLDNFSVVSLTGLYTKWKKDFSVTNRAPYEPS